MRIDDLDIRSFIERLTDIVLLVSSEGRVLDANAAALAAYGYARDEIIGLGVSAIRAPETHVQIGSDLRRATEGEVTFETVHVRANGDMFPVEVNSTRVSSGDEQALLSIIKDISTRKQAEEAAAEREIRYRTLAEFTEDWVFWINPDASYRYVSPSAERMTGYGPEQIIEDPLVLDTIVHTEDRDAYQAHHHHPIDAGPYRAQYRVIQPNGEVRWIEHVCNAAHSPDGEWLGRVGSNRDVTERVIAQEALIEVQRRQADEELRVSERTFEIFVANAPAAIAMFDTDMRYLAASRRFYSDYGIADNNIVGKTHYEVFPEISDGWKALHRRALAGETLRCDDDPFPRADGSIDYVRWELRPWYAGRNEIGGIVLFSEVITGQKRAAAELEATNERLESVLHAVVDVMGKVVEARDPYTQGHEEGVARVSRLIAGELGWSAEETDEVEVAALVHDIGKLAVPAEILTRPGGLDEIELQLVRTHAQRGFEILSQIPFSGPIAEIVRQHHERMDGSGYPDGLVGDAILPAARVLAAADTIEAIASHRPYRPAFPVEYAIEQVVDCAGRFDDNVVAACVRLFESGALAGALERPSSTLLP